MKAENKKFIPVMVTPFNLKAKVDLDVVKVLVEFYLAAGVKGFFANCLSSEMFSISEDERLELTQHVVKCVNGRVPVVATGSFGLTIEDKAEFTQRIYDTGVNAVVLITGHYARVEEDNDILLQNFDKMFRLTSNIPLGLYECPAPYKRILDTPVFNALLESGRIIYHKDTSIEKVKLKEKLEVVKGHEGLEFYDAHTPNTVFSLQMGAKGMSSISGNFYPEVMVWLCNHATDPTKQEQVQWLQSQLSHVDPVIHEAYPMSSKYFLQKRGLPVRPISRAHVMQLTPQQKQTLDEIYERFLNWCQHLEIPIVKEFIIQ
jgi:4-hydroxy-tetrahydrodipicolinate synthase